MNPGEQFEIDAYNYLTNQYPAAKFSYKGGMDSTVSDIEVVKKDGSSYFIEAKSPAAQSGQFVVLPDLETQSFFFSPRNKSEENELTDMIIAYMNQDFDKFNNAGTSGEKLDIDQSIFIKWIVQHYLERGVKYFISYKNGYVVLPIRKFADYFDISATFRVKGSGSSSLPKKYYEPAKEIIGSYYNTMLREEEGKLYATIKGQLSETRFPYENFKIYLSEKGSGNYEIRKLSNTYNMNVIFDIKIKKKQDPADLLEFESDL